MAMELRKLNQVVTPMAFALPDEISLLEQNSTPPGNWYATSGLGKAFLFKSC